MASALAQRYGANPQQFSASPLNSMGGAANRGSYYGSIVANPIGQAAEGRASFEAGQDRETQLAGARIGQTGARNQQNRFNQVFPWLKDQMGSMMGQFNSSVGGASGQGPAIGAGPVINPQQQQQQINAMRARQGMLSQTQDRVLGRTAAGRGLGANSGLVSALRGQNASAGRANMANQEREMRLGNASTNANFQLQAQGAREGQFANRQQEDIERRRTVAGLFPGLLNAFSGLV